MGLRKKSLAMLGVTAAVARMATTAVAAGSEVEVVAAGGAKGLQPGWVFTMFDWVVLSLLGFASIPGIALIIDAMIHTREIKVAPPHTTEHLRSLTAGRQFKELMDFTSTDQTFISQALYAAIRRAH